MAELINNRFLVAPKAVDKADKLTTTWGDLKANNIKVRSKRRFDYINKPAACGTIED